MEQENTFLTQVTDVYDALLTKTASNIFYTNTKNNIEQSLNILSISDEKKAEMLITLESNLAASTISKAMDQSILIVDKTSKIPLENALLQKQIDTEQKNIELKTAQITSIGKDDEIKDKQVLDIAKSTELKNQQIISMTKEDTIKEAQNIKELDIKTKQALDIAKSTEVKAAQITSITKDNLIKDKQVTKLDEEIDLLESQDLELKESILDRQQKRPVEVANLTKQGNLIDGQVAKINEDKLYVIAQKTSMIEQVEHNKSIKAMDSMADMIGTLGAGGLKPSSEMFKVYFTLNKKLTTVELPINYDVTKVV